AATPTGQRQRHRRGAGPGGGGPGPAAGGGPAGPARAGTGTDPVLAGPVVVGDLGHRDGPGAEARLDTALDRLEDPRDGGGGARPVRGRLGEHHHHQSAQVLVDRLRELRRLLLDLRHRDLHLARAGEGTAPVQHLVAHDAERVDVRERGGLLAHRLLGGEVLGGAHHQPGLGQPRLVLAARDPEVGDLHRPVVLLVDQHVLGLHVTVDDTLGVRGVQRAREFDEQRDHALLRQPAGVLLDEVGQRPARAQLHHDVGAAVELAVVVQRGDAVVREGGGVSGLGAEALEEALVARVLLAQHLDRDLAVQLLVTALPDLPHPPGGDQRGPFVAPLHDEPRFVPHGRITASITSWTICPTVRGPSPRSSTTTATAIFRSSCCAYPTNQEWAVRSSPHCAVPVLPPTSTPSIAAAVPVPSSTTPTIIFRIWAAFAALSGWPTSFGVSSATVD